MKSIIEDDCEANEWFLGSALGVLILSAGFCLCGIVDAAAGSGCLPVSVLSLPMSMMPTFNLTVRAPP